MILDLIVAVILVLGLLQIKYDSNPQVAKQEKIGRTIVICIMFGRFVFSCLSEFTRINWIKPIFLDQRQAFKIFCICRYIFIILLIVPAVVISYELLQLKGLCLGVLGSILGLQEGVILLMIVVKIRSSSKSQRLKYIENHV